MKEDLYSVLDQKIIEALSNIHTVTVAKITEVTGATISCQPVINRVVDGKSIQLPVFIEVPVILLQGGTSYTVHPIAVDDYCLLFFNERCFDRWYAGDDFQDPLEMRTHDYSDAFAIVGVQPKSGEITIPSTTTHNGDRINDGVYTNNGDVNFNGVQTQSGDVFVTGDMTINGNLTVTGNITCGGMMTVPAIVVNGIPFATHTHRVTSLNENTTGAQ
jgi:hypothetical protein